MVLPPSTAEELEVVLATKRRLGVSEDPQKVRKAVLELRQRRATAAWKTWYAAQQAAAQAHHARFLQWQWHMERQHAAGLAAAAMAAEQRAAAAERREREAAAQRRDAEEANTAAAAAWDAELARLRDAAAAVRAVEAVRDEIGVFSERRAVEASPLLARHEKSVEMCGKQFDSDATDGGGGADVCDDGGAEGFHEPDEVFAGAAPDLDDAAAPLYGDDDDVEMEGVVGGGDGVEAPPRERPAVPQAFCKLAEAFADARRRLFTDGRLYAEETARYVQYLDLDRGTTFSARTAESLGLREYMHRLTRDFGACIKPDAWDASIGGDYEQWCSEKHKASLEVMFSRAERYLRACGCADLAASVEALVDELDWEELKRQEERYEAFADESDDGFKSPAAALRALGLSVAEAAKITSGRLSETDLRKLRRRVKRRGGLVVLSFFDGAGVLAWSILNELQLKIKRYIAVEIDDDAHNCLMMHCGSQIEEVVRVDDVRDEDAIVAAINGNVVDVFSNGSPCDGTSGRNFNRLPSIKNHPTSGLVSYTGEWHERLQRMNGPGEPFITCLENVGSMMMSVRREFDEVLGADVHRYVVDEVLFGGAPRKRYYWTNAPVETLSADAVNDAQRGIRRMLQDAGSIAVPVRRGQELATIVTCTARGCAEDENRVLKRPRSCDYDRCKETSNTGNWVCLSKSCDVIRQFTVYEGAVALNLPPFYFSGCGANETVQRRVMGMAFGARSIAHVLKCLV